MLARMKDPRFGRSNWNAGDGGNLIETEPLAKEQNSGEPVIIAQASQGLVDLRLHLTARRLTGFGRRIERRRAQPIALNPGDSIGAFAPQDAKCPARKHGGIRQTRPAPAYAGPGFLHRLFCCLDVAKAAGQGSDDPGPLAGPDLGNGVRHVVWHVDFYIRGRRVG